MGRFLFWLLLALGLVLWWRSRAAARPSASAEARPAAAAPQAMVVCGICGLHLPRVEALTDAQGRSFCSTEHREAQAAADARAGR